VQTDRLAIEDGALLRGKVEAEGDEQACGAQGSRGDGDRKSRGLDIGQLRNGG